MKKKAISDAERRQQLEVEAAQRRAAEMKSRADAEHESIQRAMNYYENTWGDFAKDSKKSKSLAYANLKDNLAEGASFLVPHLMTAKEHMSLIAEAEQHIKGDSQHSQQDPRTLVADWLSGKIELSRIPLETTVVTDGP